VASSATRPASARTRLNPSATRRAQAPTAANPFSSTHKRALRLCVGTYNTIIDSLCVIYHSLQRNNDTERCSGERTTSPASRRPAEDRELCLPYQDQVEKGGCGRVRATRATRATSATRTPARKTPPRWPGLRTTRCLCSVQRYAPGRNDQFWTRAALLGCNARPLK
jgi:hypothetical protein